MTFNDFYKFWGIIIFWVEVSFWINDIFVEKPILVFYEKSTLISAWQLYTERNRFRTTGTYSVKLLFKIINQYFGTKK